MINIKWKREHGLDLRKPIKLWSSGGQWMRCKLICVVGDYAFVKVRYPIGEWGYKALDLNWYDKVGARCPQLRNLDNKKFKHEKWMMFKISVASFFCSKVLKEG